MNRDLCVKHKDSCTYSKGKTKKDSGQGFVIPTEDEPLRFAETVKKFPNDIFEVESLSKENVRYV